MKPAAVLPLLALLALAACGGEHRPPRTWLDKRDIPPITQERFPHCRGYGCAVVVPVSLTRAQWAAVRSGLPGRDPADERQKIARAIAAFEKTVGPLAGTADDKAGTYPNPGPFQHDCVDESANTTVYLTLLAQKGWLRHHEILAPTARMFFSLPHSTAVVRDLETGERFAVDSWFHDNGHAAEIVPLAQWKNRWHPPADPTPALQGSPGGPKTADR